MYYATKRNNTKTRVLGVVGVVAALGGSGYAIANGFGLIENKEIVETEVVMIEEVVEETDDEPPPPPVDVDLPPPPPQVILPDFVFDTPPPQENAVQQVQPVRNPSPPAPPAPAAKPAPPAITVSRSPQPGRRFEKPDYPSASRRANEAGEVRVSMCVAADGRISDVKLVKSSGFPRLDEATLKGLPRTRLDPAVGSDGKPMAMCNPPYQMTLVWNLEEAR